MATANQTKAALAVMISVTETIREMGEVPAGTIYAALMSNGCDMETYRKVEGILTGSGLVEKRGDLLRWVGPYISTAAPEIRKVKGGFNITRNACTVCGEPPFGGEYCCGHTQEVR